MTFPDAVDPDIVGTYPASAFSGGGYVWDEVLEYRVCSYPRLGAIDEYEGSDYYYAFATYDEAEEFARETVGTRPPLALVLQRKYIDEPEPGLYVHKCEERITEWPVAFLPRPRRNPETIPSFMAPDAPENKLEILRGTASP